MTKRILIIGGYGNFGSFITRKLAVEENIQVLIAGRSLEKAQALADEVGGEAVQLDINTGLSDALTTIKPDIVIHTSGPFQAQGYEVAKACIAAGAHYIDLADGREFAEHITTLNADAKERDTLVISGASSVPCLTSALVDHYRNEFQTLENLDYGITTAQKTARGLATTAAILTYTGKPFPTLINGKRTDIYG
jgi:saccharopine dehydrogenase-like NADP-dependent oxidoreductase